MDILSHHEWLSSRDRTLTYNGRYYDDLVCKSFYALKGARNAKGLICRKDLKICFPFLLFTVRSSLAQCDHIDLPMAVWWAKCCGCDFLLINFLEN